MSTKIYLKQTGQYGVVDYIDVEKLNWTGKWKYEVISKPHGARSTITTRKLHLQRRVMLLWVIPTFLCWEEEKDFEVREEEIYTNECEVTT